MERDEIVTFLDAIFAKAKIFGIELDWLELDHIAYRCESISEYLILKDQYGLKYDFKSEFDIEWRPISIFKLRDAVRHDWRVIDVIELISPKNGSKHRHWLEHAEFIVKWNLSEFEEKYPQLKFISKHDRPINPESVLIFDDGYSIKFHTRHILEVIELQKTCNF